jgi:UDP-GlcNAc:undecaprenyl-phosphate GlcNAc-1-phosphate transferase
LSIRAAHRFGVLDAPAKRKVHAQPIPRMGGTAIFGALVTVSLLCIPFIPRLTEGFTDNSPFYISIALGATMVFAVGLLDDVRNASVVARLGVQALAASLVYWYGGVAIAKVGIPFLGQVHLEWWVAYPLTVLWIVGVTNALNIIDGLDGLASGVAFIACASVFVVAMMNGQFFAMASLALLAGCLLGFLRYNSHPARIFLGDCGSLLLGFLLACIAAGCSLKRSTSFALIIPMQILALPVFDTLYSMLRRVAREVFIEKNRSPRAITAMFKADRGHIHHSLLDLGFSHVKVVWLLYALSFTLGAFGMLSALFLEDLVSLVFLVLGGVSFVLVRNYGTLKRWLISRRQVDAKS